MARGPAGAGVSPVTAFRKTCNDGRVGRTLVALTRHQCNSERTQSPYACGWVPGDRVTLFHERADVEPARSRRGFFTSSVCSGECALTGVTAGAIRRVRTGTPDSPVASIGPRLKRTRSAALRARSRAHAGLRGSNGQTVETQALIHRHQPGPPMGKNEYPRLPGRVYPYQKGEKAGGVSKICRRRA